ncbi:hypothetical protein M0638_12580 [Roseomonas sp. NAR14]|uniref:Uncharacterized protein n=1 Tax=Roseomonas acroporae TaxID=2937791 RepID=A0A9X1YFE1_9PROT|nr:hypothetical protein [Roseomonas acroporae]MCK8785221.1 hypothetical protein [Roseomonas acroporae]
MGGGGTTVAAQPSAAQQAATAEEEKAKRDAEIKAQEAAARLAADNAATAQRLRGRFALLSGSEAGYPAKLGGV